MHIRSRRLGGFAVAAAAAMVLATACTPGSTTDPTTDVAGFGECDAKPTQCNAGLTKPGGTLVYYEEQDIATWNLNSEDGGHYPSVVMLNAVIPGVYYAAPDLTPAINADLMLEEPKLTSNSPQTIVYKIRPEAVWSDGTPISADDFVYQFKTQNTRDCPECAAASNSGYDIMDAVVGSDNGKTVTVTFQAGKTYPDWKSLFGALYPAHVAKANGGVETPDQLKASWDNFTATQPAWSGGPYVIESYTEGQQLIEVPNPQWYGRSKPALEKLIFKIVTDQSSLVPALRNGEIDAADPQPNLDMVTQLGQLPGVYSKVGSALSWEHIDLNLKNKFLADKPLREAIFKAINVQGIIDRTIGTFYKTAKPLYNHNFVPGSPYYKDVVSATGAGTGDIEAAKQVLTAAGYRDVGTALKTPSGEEVTLRFRHTAGNVNRAATAELVQSYLKQLGIKVEIVTTDALSRTLAQGDYDMIIFAWVASPFFFAGADQLWGAGSGSNFGQWVNEDADALLKRALQEGLDEAKGADLLNQANELMARDFYVLPLFQRANLQIAREIFANVRPNATSTGPTYNVSEWGLRAAAAQ